MRALLFDLLRRSEQRQPDSDWFDPGRIANYVQQHYFEALDNTVLAREFHFHPNYISAEFRRRTGTPLHRYVLQVRILKAISYMESGNRSLSEIATAVGFRDSNYFSRYFKQIIGVSPRDYQRQRIR